jgi:hypothetical protein
MKRRDFLKLSAGASLGFSLSAADMASEILEYQKPVFNLHKFFNARP